MKKQILLTSFLLLCSIVGQAQNYSLTIDGKSMDLDLNQPVEFQTKDGNTLNIVINKKEILRFKSDFFSMKHKSSLSPIKSDLGDGVHQTLMASGLGTGVLLQEYQTMDPSGFVDLMIEELTKEEVGYGYQKKVEAIEKKVGDFVLRGKKVITTHKDEEWTRCVYSFGKKDAGILIITMIERDEYESESFIISDFWQSLELAIK